MHAEDGRTGRTGVLVGAPSALLPAAVNKTPDTFTVAGAEEGRCSNGAALPLSLPPTAAPYAEDLGWPVTMQANEVVLRCGDVLDIVTMPIGLAGEVNHILKLHNVDVPVMEVKGPRGTWAFFCQPRLLSSSGKQAMPGLLGLHGVTHFGFEAQVPLPPGPSCDSETLRWVVGPKPESPEPLPPWGTLVSCTLRAIER